MCGICGALLNSGAVNAEDLAPALSMMKSRGPDEQGVWIHNNLGLGHVRLSIIDLSCGQQPMLSTDGKYCLVFNGEIYNFQQIRQELCKSGAEFHTHSDSEVILELYRCYREKCVDHLRGMFAFAVYDIETREIFLARDRMGVKPLVYAQTSRGFFFASTVSALLILAPELREQPDYQSLASYFAQMSITAPRTAYRLAKKMPAGHFLQFKADQSTVTDPQRYWFPENARQRCIDPDEAIKELRNIVDEAVAMRMVAERPVGAFLSGGVDSGVVVSSMALQMDRPVQTFTVGFDGSDLDERDAARRMAGHIGADHHEIVLSPDDRMISTLENIWDSIGEPFGDQSLLPSAFVAFEAARDLTVVLTGDGPDELWGGYKRHRHARQLMRLEQLGLRKAWLFGRELGAAFQRLRGKDKRLPLNHLDKLLMLNKDQRALSLRLAASERAELISLQNITQFGDEVDYPETIPANDSWDAMTQYSYYDMQAYQQGVVIPKVDTATMFFSLEARSPFLDQELVQWTLQLPERLKLHPRYGGKYLLKKAFRERVPDSHFDQPKRYFSPPVAHWIRGPLKPWIEELLLENPGRHLFHKSKIRAMLNAHGCGKDFSTQLWMAAAFAYWVRSEKIVL